MIIQYTILFSLHSLSTEAAISSTTSGSIRGSSSAVVNDSIVGGGDGHRHELELLNYLSNNDDDRHRLLKVATDVSSALCLFAVTSILISYHNRFTNTNLYKLILSLQLSSLSLYSTLLSTLNIKDRTLYCGVPNKCASLGGNTVITSKETLAGVRCCTSNISLGWPSKCRSSSNSGIYGESNVPRCYRDSTFEEALEICGAYDGKFICFDVCRTSGISAIERDAMNIRCVQIYYCYIYRSCGYRNVSSKCLSNLSPLLLSSPYSKTGGRLCTGEEILDRCTAGTGCSLNKALVWACTASNTSTCSESAECCSGLCNASGVCEDVNVGGPPPDTSSPSTSPSTSPTKGPTNVVSVSIHVCVFYFSQLSVCEN